MKRNRTAVKTPKKESLAQAIAVGLNTQTERRAPVPQAVRRAKMPFLVGPRGVAHASLPLAPSGRLTCGCFINCPGPAYHAGEATRIRGELDRLGPEFPEDGAVHTILRERIAEERKRGGSR